MIWIEVSIRTLTKAKSNKIWTGVSEANVRDIVNIRGVANLKFRGIVNLNTRDIVNLNIRDIVDLKLRDKVNIIDQIMTCLIRTHMGRHTRNQRNLISRDSADKEQLAMKTHEKCLGRTLTTELHLAKVKERLSMVRRVMLALFSLSVKTPASVKLIKQI